MQTQSIKILADLLEQEEATILKEWLRLQQANSSRKSEFLADTALKEPSTEFLRLLKTACRSDDMDIHDSDQWEDIRSFLHELSRTRALQDFSPSETAMFVFSIKQPIFRLLRTRLSGDDLANELWTVTELIDKLGLYITECHQSSREEVINRQQQEMMELSAPVIRIWEDVLAVPIIGVLDSARTQVIMENLLGALVNTGCKIAILDITGVPTVDTATAQHLIRTVSAAKLMGARCIVSGIRPQIAQTIVHLGIEITDIPTEAKMYDALRTALQQRGWQITKNARQSRWQWSQQNGQSQPSTEQPSGFINNNHV